MIIEEFVNFVAILIKIFTVIYYSIEHFANVNKKSKSTCFSNMNVEQSSFNRIFRTELKCLLISLRLKQELLFTSCKIVYASNIP